MENGQVILVDFYDDEVTLSKPGNQSATFYRKRFSNIEKFSETWYIILIGPTTKTKTMNPSLPADKKSFLNWLMLQQFLFTLFRLMIRES